MSNVENREFIQKLTIKLCEEIPNSQYGSYHSLYLDALKAGLITEKELALAEKYYGYIWDYAGD